ncbi:hypothetical protein pb186bvf_006885 [Paramecium bursaria]
MGNHCQSTPQVLHESEIIQPQSSIISLKGKFQNKADTTHDHSQISNLMISQQYIYSPNKRCFKREPENPSIRIPTDSSTPVRGLDEQNNLLIPPKRQRQFEDQVKNHKVKSKEKKNNKQKSKRKSLSKSQDKQKKQPQSYNDKLQFFEPPQPIKGPSKKEEIKFVRKYSDSPPKQKSPRKNSNTREERSHSMLNIQKQLITPITIPVPIIKRKDSSHSNQDPSSPLKKVRFSQSPQQSQQSNSSPRKSRKRSDQI